MRKLLPMFKLSRILSELLTQNCALWKEHAIDTITVTFNFNNVNLKSFKHVFCDYCRATINLLSTAQTTKQCSAVVEAKYPFVSRALNFRIRMLLKGVVTHLWTTRPRSLGPWFSGTVGLWAFRYLGFKFLFFVSVSGCKNISTLSKLFIFLLISKEH